MWWLDAIDLDIHRLTTLLPHWPTFFTHLNAARNFVQTFCSASRFRYTGHPDVDPEKFRLYVHFNAAKKAWREGKFVLGEEPDGEAVREKGCDATVQVIGGKEMAQNGYVGVYAAPKEMGGGWYNVSTAPYGTRVGKSGLWRANDRVGSIARPRGESMSASDTADGTVVTPTTPSDASPATVSVDCVDELRQGPGHDVVSSSDEMTDVVQDACVESANEDEEEDEENVDPFKVFLALHERFLSDT